MALYLTQNGGQRTNTQQSGISPMQGYNMYQNFAGGGGDSGSWINSLFGGSGGGGGSSAGSSTGGMGGGAIGGIILAAILGQLAASNNTDTEFEGQKTGNVFSGLHLDGDKKNHWSPSFATEPWLAWLHDKLGWEPTSGEKFDAAVKNKDYGKALSRLPSTLNYWSNPAGAWLGYDTMKNVLPDSVALVLDPMGGLFEKIEDWF